ncbi:hypothetical protein PCANC_05716 [Puccinia coronata f. sp. avenae]|uniref:Uncharacterized protein n=1 Tax=Puccinia coronata f. sp. avenae TaxID=200324 RepID=A0A2N5TZP7_9BASI|nr:hypothetical protein PCASD_14845 [Puccinia coronata f. sp. avenae]PLW52947.1 hypothetical protein PCANC_05716 [Puccinia coronata f. sp. avenae]
MGLQEWEANVKVKTQQPPSQHPSSNKKMSDQTSIAFQLPPIPEATVVPGPPQASGSGSSHPAPAAKNTDHKTKRKPPKKKAPKKTVRQSKRVFELNGSR